MSGDKEEDIDYYEVLGLTFSISSPPTPKDIKKAYRSKAKVLHPDKNRDDPKADEKFHVLNTAYETLIDPEKKKEFDTKCSAKMKRKRQLAEMDEEMRKKRGDLEAREREAKRRKAMGGARLGDLAGKWRKESIRSENMEIRRMMEEEEKARLKARRSEEFSSNGNGGANPLDNRAILRVNWGKRYEEFGRNYTSEDLTVLFSRWGTVGSVVVGGGMKGIVEIEGPNMEALEALVAKSATTGPFVVRWKKKPERKAGGNGGRISKQAHDSLEASILKRMSSSSQAKTVNAAGGGGGGGGGGGNSEESILKRMASNSSVGGGGASVSSEESILKKMSSTPSVGRENGGGKGESFEDSILKRMASNSSVGGGGSGEGKKDE